MGTGCQSLADLRLFRADLVQYPRCGSHGGLQWFQVNLNDQPCWRLTPQCAVCNPRRHRLSPFTPAADGAVECSARRREAKESGRPRSADRLAVVGNLDLARPEIAIQRFWPNNTQDCPE